MCGRLEEAAFAAAGAAAFTGASTSNFAAASTVASTREGATTGAAQETIEDRDRGVRRVLRDAGQFVNLGSFRFQLTQAGNLKMVLLHSYGGL